MFGKHFALVHIFFLVYLCSVVCGATSTFYVATDGTINTNCSETFPCSSLQDVFLVVSTSYDDVIIYVGGGSYQGPNNVNVDFPTNAASLSILEWENMSAEHPTFIGNGSTYCFIPAQTLSMKNLVISDCDTAISISEAYVDLILTNVIITNPSQYKRTGISSLNSLGNLELNSCSFSGSAISTTVDTFTIYDSTFVSSTVTMYGSMQSGVWQISSSEFYSGVYLYAGENNLNINDSYLVMLDVQPSDDGVTVESLKVTNTIFDCADDDNGITVDYCNTFAVDNVTFTNTCRAAIVGEAANFTMKNSFSFAYRHGVYMRSSVSVLVDNSTFGFIDTAGTTDLYSLDISPSYNMNKDLPVSIKNSYFYREIISNLPAIYVQSSSSGVNATISDCLFNNTLALEFSTVEGSLSCYGDIVNITQQYSTSYIDSYAFHIVDDNGGDKEASFSHCHFYGRLGAIYSDIPLNVTNSKFLECESASGGAISMQNAANIDFCNFTKCTANSGGAIYAYITEPVYISIQHSVFDSNEANDGGAIYITDSGYCFSYDFAMVNVSFTNNLAGDGAAMYCSDEDDCGDISIENMENLSNYNTYGGSDAITCKYNGSTSYWYLWVFLFLGIGCLCCMIVMTAAVGKVAINRMNSTSKYEPIPE